MRNASRTTNNEQLITREYAQYGSRTTNNEQQTTRNYQLENMRNRSSDYFLQISHHCSV